MLNVLSTVLIVYKYFKDFDQACEMLTV